MQSINISSDVAKVAKEFAGKMNAKNIRFATALSLTRLAQGAQERVRTEMPKEAGGPFYVRRKWVPSGIRIKAASPSGLKSEVYSLDSGGRRPFMRIQEHGGIKTPSVADHLAVPTKWAQPNKRVVIRNEMKPKALLGAAVPAPKANASTTVMRQSGFERKITRGRGDRKVIVREKINFSSPYKTLLVKGKRAGTKFIMVKVAGKYQIAWRLIPRANIKRTQFLAGPAYVYVSGHAQTTLMQNFRQVMRSG